MTYRRGCLFAAVVMSPSDWKRKLILLRRKVFGLREILLQTYFLLMFEFLWSVNFDKIFGNACKASFAFDILKARF